MGQELPKKRKIGHKKGKGRKKIKAFDGGEKKVKMDGKLKKLFRKKVRDYNSDDTDDEHHPVTFEKDPVYIEKDEEDDDKKSSDDENDNVGNENSDDDSDVVVVDQGIMKFSQGNASFKKAFKKIVNTTATDEVLGPVLSAHKNLVVKKLAEEAAQRKVKGEAKKEKTLLGEKGHVKPDAFSVSHEKLLIGVATKGVVKLFNAVNKAQTSQKGLNPSRSKDAKVIQKRRKEAFFSELGKASSDAKIGTTGGAGDAEVPAWAPLRDNYMLTTSKLKDWDKAADAPETTTTDFGRQEDSLSEDDDDEF